VYPPTVKNLNYQLIENDLVEISSTQIRSRLNNRQPINKLVPPNINPMIQEYFPS